MMLTSNNFNKYHLIIKMTRLTFIVMKSFTCSHLLTCKLHARNINKISVVK